MHCDRKTPLIRIDLEFALNSVMKHLWDLWWSVWGGRWSAEEGLASSDLYTRCSEISGDARRDDACAAALSDCETALRLTEALAAVTIGDGLVRGSAADDL